MPVKNTGGSSEKGRKAEGGGGWQVPYRLLERAESFAPRRQRWELSPRAGTKQELSWLAKTKEKAGATVGQPNSSC